MANVFISYKRDAAPDDELARFLAQELSQKGHVVFIDLNMQPGVKWEETIVDWLEKSELAVVLLSESAAASEWVRHEVVRALRLSKRLVAPLKILPIRINGFLGLPAELGELSATHYGIWRDGQKLQDAVDLVTSAVRGTCDRLRTSSFSGWEVKQDLPLPMVETGTMIPTSPFYVRRESDDRVDQSFKQEFFTVIVKGPRQFGKSSLLARMHLRAREAHRDSLYIDFQMLDGERLRTLNAMLEHLAWRINAEFNATLKPSDCFQPPLGAMENLTNYIEKALLTATERNYVFCFDEVDRLFASPYRDDFFAMVRSWHNRRATHAPWRKLSLALGHSTDPVLWIQNLYQSPFNVGDQITLMEFTLEHIELLNGKYGGPLRKNSDVRTLLDLVGGQPYLVRVALHYLSKTKRKVAALERAATDADGPFGDHLRWISWMLHNDQDLKTTLRSVIRQGNCGGNRMACDRLLASGLIRQEGTVAVARCRLYQMHLESQL